MNNININRNIVTKLTASIYVDCSSSMIIGKIVLRASRWDYYIGRQKLQIWNGESWHETGSVPAESHATPRHALPCLILKQFPNYQPGNVWWEHRRRRGGLKPSDRESIHGLPLPDPERSRWRHRRSLQIVEVSKGLSRPKELNQFWQCSGKSCGCYVVPVEPDGDVRYYLRRRWQNIFGDIGLFLGVIRIIMRQTTN